MCIRDRPYPFATNLARFTYFQKENSFPNYVPFESQKWEVVMLSGLPGTGKDTYIQKYYKDWPIVSLDNIRRAHKISPKNTKANGKVLQIAKEMMKMHLRKQQPFVFNATNILQQLRGNWINLFTTYGATVKIVYLEVPYERLMRQNQNREHIVPIKVMEKMIQKLEVPSLVEAETVVYLTVN